jgi:hypothetical protein
MYIYIYVHIYIYIDIYLLKSLKSQFFGSEAVASIV